MRYRHCHKNAHSSWDMNWTACVIFPKYLLCRLWPGGGSLQIPADGDTRQVRVQLQGAGHLPHALSKRGEIYILVKNIMMLVSGTESQHELLNILIAVTRDLGLFLCHMNKSIQSLIPSQPAAAGSSPPWFIKSLLELKIQTDLRPDTSWQPVWGQGKIFWHKIIMTKRFLKILLKYNKAFI